MIEQNILDAAGQAACVRARPLSVTTGGVLAGNLEPLPSWRPLVVGHRRHVSKFRVPKAPLGVIVPEGCDLDIEIANSGVTSSFWLHPEGESTLPVEVMEEGTRILAITSAKIVPEPLTDGIIARLDQLFAEVAMEPKQDVMAWRLDPQSGPGHTARRFAPTKFTEIQMNCPDPTRSLLARLIALEELDHVRDTKSGQQAGNPVIMKSLRTLVELAPGVIGVRSLPHETDQSHRR